MANRVDLRRIKALDLNELITKKFTIYGRIDKSYIADKWLRNIWGLINDWWLMVKQAKKSRWEGYKK